MGLPRDCAAGARDGKRWYLLCSGRDRPWLSVLQSGAVRVLAPRLGHGLRDGWVGSYLRAMLSPDRRQLLLQHLLELHPLLVVQQRFDPLLPVAQHRPIVLPEVVQHELHLLRLRRAPS